MESTQAIVVGAGQAGLAASYELKQRGVDHIVVERAHIGEGWHQRWESFCLVTPNWTVQLPGFHYDGGDPD
ncbi:MAG: FAD-dependent oxidoreductase, partial [Alphaproteobacteria bacterium]